MINSYNVRLTEFHLISSDDQIKLQQQIDSSAVKINREIQVFMMVQHQQRSTIVAVQLFVSGASLS